MPRKTYFKDLGRLDYDDAWRLQTKLHNELKERKLNARKSGETIDHYHYLLFVEHNHVYTLGKSGKIDHLVYSERELMEHGIQFLKINRGGDITYHGKGQLTVYPIFDLDDFFHDVHKYVRLLEEVVIQALSELEIKAHRRSEYTGVWVKNNDQEEKICAIGIHLSRWVSMHGIAFNINTDLDYFNGIVPCGINEKTSHVCSVQSLIGTKQVMTDIKDLIKLKFQKVFELEYLENKKGAL